MIEFTEYEQTKRGIRADMNSKALEESLCKNALLNTQYRIIWSVFVMQL